MFKCGIHLSPSIAERVVLTPCMNLPGPHFSTRTGMCACVCLSLSQGAGPQSAAAAPL